MLLMYSPSMVQEMDSLRGPSGLWLISLESVEMHLNV